MLNIFSKDAEKPTGLLDNPSLRDPMRDPKIFQKEIAYKILNKILRDEGIKALERERKEEEEKKLLEKLEKQLDKRYVKKEEDKFFDSLKKGLRWFVKIWWFVEKIIRLIGKQQ